MPFARNEVTNAHGKRLSYSDTLIGARTEVFGTVDVNLPERELEEEDVTSDDSPDFTKEFDPALYDPGEVGFTYKYTKTQFTALETLFQLASAVLTRKDATKFWKILYPDGSSAIFQGYLKAHNLPGEGATTLQAEGAIRVKGKVTWAAGA